MDKDEKTGTVQSFSTSVSSLNRFNAAAEFGSPNGRIFKQKFKISCSI